MMVKLNDFNEKFKTDFEKEKKRILELINEVEIYHIGSTAIKGIKGKGIVDILIYVEDWGRKNEILDKLRNLSYSHVHPEESGRIFLSNKKETRIGDFHIHLTGSKKIVDELNKFVSALNKDGDLRKEYEEIKIKASRISDRKEYGRIKGEFIEKVIE